MGDSDDDFNDGRRRDKFTRERNDYLLTKNNTSGGWSFNDNNTNWQQRDRMMVNRNSNQRTDSFGRRERYGSPGYDMPQVKRNRLNPITWTDERSNYNQNNFDSYDLPYGNNQNQNDIGLTQPAMMSFKQFMKRLDDSIDHLEASKKYNEYKFDFKRKQIAEFFAAHKDEEWFRLKYHPDESVKRKEQLRSYVKNRAKVFMDLYRSNLIGSTTIDIENSDQITNVLDSAVIKLEGGTDYDLNCLKESLSFSEKSKDNLLDFNEDEIKSEGVEDLDVYELKNEDNLEEERNNKEKNINENANLDEDVNLSENKEPIEMNKDEQKSLIDSNENDEENVESDDKFEDLNETKKEKCEEMKVDQELDDNKIENINEENKEEDKPRPLHKTYSIFLRYLPANIKKEEIENMFKLYPEYLRVALADPAFDKRFQRRGWVTFDRTVDIRRIYLSLNNVRIRDCEVGAIINRDLSRRIRSVNGIASHKLNVIADIKHTTKIILNLDEEKRIWDFDLNDETDKVDGLPEPITVFDCKTRNILLENIEKCLRERNKIDDVNLDKDGDLGEIKDENENELHPMERNNDLIKILDNLIFYLRIVHSLDYYNHINYPNEDEMPNRIGIMHARGMAPTAEITLKEVNDYIKQFENKISSYLERNVYLSEDELEKLGKRKVEEEIDKFIQENTKELKKDQWLCLLSKKKFITPAFVRKHIETKHASKLEEVKKDTEFFNLYLADSKRPQLPEHPFNRTMNKQYTDNVSNSNWNSSQSSYSNTHQRTNFAQNIISSNNGNRYNNYRNGMSKFNRKRNYRDLDAPVDDM